MEKEYLTLKQNLCGARLFLNLFNLYLEDKEDVNEFTTLNIYNEDNSIVGNLYFENGVVKIKSITPFGTLNANYDVTPYNGFLDFEVGGAFVSWSHNIKFQVEGNLNFNGDVLIGVSMDTDFGNNCDIHSKIYYIDKNNNKVEIMVMNDGDPFSYVASNGSFYERLEISPFNDFTSFMYHDIRNGDFDDNNHCFPNQISKFVKINGRNDEEHIKTVSSITKNSKNIEYNVKLYKKLGKDNDCESTIQKGLLMHKIDKDFAKKIDELIKLFNVNNVSFLSNLLDVSFNKVNDEERKALFGKDIPKMKFYNGTKNVLDAYFGGKENSYKKELKR